ncbi:hypothetical protein AAHE18_11G120800 [Arachis hypogaea]
MPRSRINGNFIDKTFSIEEPYEMKISPQSEGNYAEALQNYYEAMRLEIDPYDRSYILYNIGLIHTSNGEHTKALEYYFRALERNPFLPQAFNNMAVICHYAIRQGDSEIAEAWFDQAAEYWKQAIALTPGNYIEAQNWLKITGRS